MRTTSSRAPRSAIVAPDDDHCSVARAVTTVAHKSVRGRQIGPPWRPTVADQGGKTPAGGEQRPASSFRALMVLTVIMFLSPQAYFPILAPLRIALIAAILALLTLLLERLRRGEPLI